MTGACRSRGAAPPRSRANAAAVCLSGYGTTGSQTALAFPPARITVTLALR